VIFGSTVQEFDLKTDSINTSTYL